MNTIAIIQARMGSTRLPGKVLKKILGKPMLELQLERIKKAKLIDRIVVATTTKLQDDPIVLLTKKLKVAVYRGSEVNVLDRYYQAAHKYQADIVVRLTGDCPLIDPTLIDQAINVLKTGDYDYVSNVHIRSFPRGMDVEVFNFPTLRKSWHRAKTTYDREHATAYIYSHPRHFRLKVILAPQNLRRPDLRLTVDEPDDLKLIRQIYQRLYPQKPNFNLQDIIILLDQHPKLTTINQTVTQKVSPHQRLA